MMMPLLVANGYQIEFVLASCRDHVWNAAGGSLGGEKESFEARVQYFQLGDLRHESTAC
jgi:hypothetical protein